MENRTGKKEILLVDDEEMIVDMFSIMLKEAGFIVTACTNSKHALDTFTENPKKYDLIISDYTMPRMTGLELAEKMLEIRSDTIFVMNTGYADHLTPEVLKKHNIVKVLIKPIIAKELIKTISDILAR